LIGGGFGAVRGLVLLGFFSLIVEAMTPSGPRPAWIAQSTLYPVARGGGQMLRAIAPKGFAVAGYLTPRIKQAVTSGASDRPISSGVEQSPEKGYGDAARRRLDDVVEKSL
jgi:membrane protein required for colicin V production